MILTLSGARIRLTLRDWEGYPDNGPMIAKFVAIIGDGEERVLKSALESLTPWYPALSLTDIARELVERGEAMLQGLVDYDGQ